MIRHDRRMTGRLVRPLQTPADGDDPALAPPALPGLRAPTEWMDQAACARPQVSGLPWIADSDQVEPADTEAMAQVCARCPVRLQCGRFLRPAGVTGGFWAGEHRDRPEQPRVRVTRLPKAGSPSQLPGRAGGALTHRSNASSTLHRRSPGTTADPCGAGCQG